MILLDENINEDQCSLLAQWNIKTKQVGVDVKVKGISDENIILALHGLKGVLFITRDNDFWDAQLCHSNYCLVYLEVRRNEIAYHIRKFLKHSDFNTMKKRLGKVVKVSQTVIAFYKKNDPVLKIIKW